MPSYILFYVLVVLLFIAICTLPELYDLVQGYAIGGEIVAGIISALCFIFFVIFGIVAINIHLPIVCELSDVAEKDHVIMTISTEDKCNAEPIDIKNNITKTVNAYSLDNNVIIVEYQTTGTNNVLMTDYGVVLYDADMNSGWYDMRMQAKKFNWFAYNEKAFHAEVYVTNDRNDLFDVTNINNQ